MRRKSSVVAIRRVLVAARQATLTLTAAMTAAMIMTLAMTLVSGCAVPDDSSILAPPDATTRARLSLVFGQDDANAPILGQVAHVFVDNRGNSFVVDLQQAAIYHFDASGRFIGQMGRRGDGPGEFAMPSMAVGDGDSLYVWDLMTNRVSTFDVASHRFSRAFTIASEGRLYPYAMLGVSDRGLVVRFTRQPVVDNGGASMMDEVRLLDRSGAGRRTIAVTPTAEYQVVEGNSMPVIPRPFGRGSLCAFGGTPHSLVLCGFTDNMLLTEYDISGDSLDSFGINASALPVTAADREQVLARYAPNVQAQLDIPATHRAFDRLFVDDEGRAWVRVRPQTEGTSIWWRIAADRMSVQAVEFPADANVYGVRGPLVTVLESGADGQQRVAVYVVD